LPTSISWGRRRAAVSSSGGWRANEREQLLRTYRRIAPVYDLLDFPFEQARYRSIRPLLFEGLKGRILDAGVGTGRNIAHYPPVAEVTGIDLSPAMLQRAERRRSRSTANVRLLPMDLTDLKFADHTFDAAVASFVFCTMPCEARRTALRELSRVVKPDGSIRLLEYTAAPRKLRRGLARCWQPWVAWAFGAKLDGDVEPELSDAGFDIIRSRFVTATIKLVEAKRSPAAGPPPFSGRE
jgi:ubiquinone/menaquinone biosynthesis C-methylase UbiE